MGNIVLEEGQISSYLEKNPLACTEYSRMVAGSQQFRSHRLSKVVKLDICDTRSMFRNEVTK